MKLAKKIENEIRRKSKIKKFITPDYEKYCVCNIPNITLSIFGIKTKRKIFPEKLIEDQFDGIKRVVVILIDSLGYRFLLRVLKKDKEIIFNELIKKGEFFPLTSTFPSMTPITLTTYNTGLTPQEHGIISSSFFLKKIGKVINVLHFDTVEDVPENLKKFGIKPKDLLKSETIFEKLKKNKIKSFIITFEDFLGTDFNDLIYRGGKEIGYKSYRDSFIKLRKVLEKNKKVYVFSYFYEIDALLHDIGFDQEILIEELKELLSSFKKEFVNKIDPKIAKETLLIITSDHGQIELSKKKMLYLREHPNLLKNLSTAPMGGIRYIFFKLKKNKKKEVKKYLSKFKGKALIIETSKALRKGLFGSGNINKKIYKRIGDILLIPYKNYAFLSPFKEEQEEMLAQHGGLSDEEMLVPFICVKLSKLK